MDLLKQQLNVSRYLAAMDSTFFNRDDTYLNIFLRISITCNLGYIFYKNYRSIYQKSYFTKYNTKRFRKNFNIFINNKNE